MSTDQPTSTAELAEAVTKSISDHWRLFLAEGEVLIFLGLAAIILPPLALGWLFLIGGAVGLVSTIGAHRAPGYAWSLFSAVVALLAGIVLLWNPWQGLATLTYVLIAFFIVDGILIIVLALQHRRELTGRWESMMIGGVLDLVLALIIIFGLQASALGFLVGIDLVWGGASLIAMALAARAQETL
jgi:uncharacterized membrane protein HdeD (DUF308 family)